MEKSHLANTDEGSPQEDTDDRYVLSQIPIRKSLGIKQGVPLQYEYVKVSKGGANQTEEGWQKPSRKFRTRGVKAKSSVPEVGRDENFYGALASDEDGSESEPGEDQNFVAEQAAGSQLDDDCGLQAIQDTDDSKLSQAQSLVAEEHKGPQPGHIGRIEVIQGPSEGKQSAWDQDIWNPVDFGKAVWGSTIQRMKDTQITPERLHSGKPERKPDIAEEGSDKNGEVDLWVTTTSEQDSDNKEEGNERMTTDSEQDSDNDGEGYDQAGAVTIEPQLDAFEEGSDDDGEGDEWADAVSIQDDQPQDCSKAPVLEVADSEPKLSEPDIGGKQAKQTTKKRNRKSMKKTEVNDTTQVKEVSSIKDTSPAKDASTRRYIADLTSRHRFVDPEGLSLAPDTTLYHLDIKSESTVPRSQIVALTLNECCVTAGKGEVLWVSPPIAKV